MNENYQNQNQYPCFNQNDNQGFNQFSNTENVYSSYREEAIKQEINLTIRLGFIRKVYGILSIQLFITTLFCLLAMTSLSLKLFMLNHKGVMLFMLTLVIILPILIVCFPGIMRQVPQNYIILLAFIVGESYFVGYICAYTKPEVVFMAAAMTFVMVLSLTFYAIKTNTDITMQGGLFFILSAALFLFVIFSFFIRNSFFMVIIALLCVILFSFYIIYDTQIIMGNRQEMIQVDDYILGAFMLYTDIISLFLELLRIISYFSNN